MRNESLHLTEVTIREPRDADGAAVEALIAAAFDPMPFSNGTEPTLPEALRRSGAAVVELVAERAGTILGQVVFSPVTLGGRPSRWHALGPVAVSPPVQRQGLGSRLIREGLARLRATGSEGCIVLGSPAYYPRFGFRPAPELAGEGTPAEFLMALSFGATWPDGVVAFHPAFGEG